MHETRKAALKDLLEERRGLINPTAHGYPRPPGKGRRAAGLSQKQVAELCNVSLTTYRNLESGTSHKPGIDMLRCVAKLLGFNEQEWRSLCRFAGIGDPPGPLTPLSGKEIPGVWQEQVDGNLHPSYVTDASWDLVAYNQPFARLFPNGRIPGNTMRWMTLDPAGRRMLTHWETAWAPLVLPQLKAALVARPDDESLLRLERDVLADPACAPIYKTGSSGPIHPDGDERPIRHAVEGPGWVTMCAAEPMAAPGSRVVTLIFHAGERRRHARTPVLRSR